MSLEEFYAIDECLFDAKNKFAFRIFIPNKPAKFGILIHCGNSIGHPYTHNIHVYAGKPEITKDNPLYIPAMGDRVMALINHIRQFQEIAGRTLVTDQLYTGFYLTEKLLSLNMMCLGTLQSNRIGIPAEIKDTSQRDTFSYQIYWEKEKKDISVHSYVVDTKAKKKKNVLMLTSRPPQNGKVLVRN